MTNKIRKEDSDDSTQHPVGFFGGGGVGAVAGAAVGSLAGPAGTAAGATIGGFLGAKTGEGAAAWVNPEEERAYWRENYESRDYASDDKTYEDFEPAYRAGYTGHIEHADDNSKFDDVEDDIRTNYERDNPKMSWDNSRGAAQDAWNRSAQLRKERLDASSKESCDVKSRNKL